MANSIQFSLAELSNNPKFNFLNSIKNTNSDSKDFLDIEDIDSPYSPDKFTCNYYDETQYAAKYQNSNKFSIMTFNVQSLPSKFSEFKDFIENLASKNCKPDVICIQEVWNITDTDLFSLTDYHPPCFKLRSKSNGGGVGVYVSSQYSFQILPNNIFHEKILESLFIELTLQNKKKLTIGTLYRSNSAHPNLTSSEQSEQFMDYFNNLLQLYSDKDQELIITGDFNIDILNYNYANLSTNYVDTLFANGLLQTVLRPTRCTSNSATCIDHILTNCNQNLYDTSIILNRISDHFPTVFWKDLHKKVSKPKYITVRDFSEAKLKKFKEQLNSLNWASVILENDPDSSLNAFSDLFYTLYDNYFNPINVNFNKNKHSINKWMTPGLLCSRKTKNILMKASIIEPSAANVSAFKTFRNLYNKLIRIRKINYYHEQIELNKSNLKKTWNIIYEVLNKKN